MKEQLQNVCQELQGTNGFTGSSRDRVRLKGCSLVPQDKIQTDESKLFVFVDIIWFALLR